MARDHYVAFGPQLYRVIRPFASWPRDLNISIFSKCAVDGQGRLLVCQRADPPVLVFDQAGALARTIGDGLAADSHGICVTPDGRVLLVDRDGHQLLCYSSDGGLLSTLGEFDHPRFRAPFSHPTDVTVGQDGDIYVADGYGNTMVHRFSADGKLKKSWGEAGSGPGQFSTPHGINVLADGRLLVGDRENNRVQIFDVDGVYLGEWRGFYHPMDIFVDHRGLIYVTDQVPRVIALTDRGQVVGSCKPAVAMPHGMSGDRHGNLYIVETRTNEITKLEPVARS